MDDKNKIFYAYDPIIRRRVAHIAKGKYAISLATGHKFKLKVR